LEQAAISRRWRTLALTAIGEGEAFFENERMSSADALARAGIAALQLEAKEGIALLNGTQAMAAVGGLALFPGRTRGAPRGCGGRHDS
jgi:histidine ammonia-lyase